MVKSKIETQIYVSKYVFMPTLSFSKKSQPLQVTNHKVLTQTKG